MNLKKLPEFQIGFSPTEKAKEIDFIIDIIKKAIEIEKSAKEEQYDEVKDYGMADLCEGIISDLTNMIKLLKNKQFYQVKQIYEHRKNSILNVYPNKEIQNKIKSFFNELEKPMNLKKMAESIRAQVKAPEKKPFIRPVKEPRTKPSHPEDDPFKAPKPRILPKPKNTHIGEVK